MRALTHGDAIGTLSARKSVLDQQPDSRFADSHPCSRHGGRGYKPVLIGRMQANGPDQLHGYAERLVGDHGPLSGTAEPQRVSLEKAGHGQSAYQVHDEDVTTATVAYLNRLGVKKRARQLSEPFSLSVGFMLQHQPYVARRQHYE